MDNRTTTAKIVGSAASRCWYQYSITQHGSEQDIVDIYLKRAHALIVTHYTYLIESLDSISFVWFLIRQFISNLGQLCEKLRAIRWDFHFFRILLSIFVFDYLSCESHPGVLFYLVVLFNSFNLKLFNWTLILIIGIVRLLPRRLDLEHVVALVNCFTVITFDVCWVLGWVEQSWVEYLLYFVKLEIT